jgi:putative oxidoreductase
MTTQAGDQSPAFPFREWSGSMHQMLEAKRALADDFISLVSRLLLAWIFVHEGGFLALNFEVASAAMAKMGVPAFALVATIVLQLAAGIAIAVGWHARPGAMALGLFCVAMAVLFHTNFASRNELLHFEKDLAIAGGMFVLMLRGSGRWSIDAMWQEKRAAAVWTRRARARVVTAAFVSPPSV